MESLGPEPSTAANPSGLPGDVLVVEDDALIAFDVEETLRELGVRSVRTAIDVARALALIDECAPDFAFLDVGLVRGDSFAVAERLEAMNIPFVFATGYDSDTVFPSHFANRRILQKPYRSEELMAALESWRGEGASAG